MSNSARFVRRFGANSKSKTTRPAGTVRQKTVGGIPLEGGGYPPRLLSQPSSLQPDAAPNAGSLPAVAGPLPTVDAAGSKHRPADDLAQVREEIRHLRAIEENLREIILASPEERSGDDYTAVVELGVQTRIDAALLRREFPEVAIAVSKQTEVVFVRIVQRRR